MRAGLRREDDEAVASALARYAAYGPAEGDIRIPFVWNKGTGAEIVKDEMENLNEGNTLRDQARRRSR